MKKKLFYLIGLIFISCLYTQGQCVGNCTTVTATLQDSSIQTWSNAIVQTIIVPPFGNPAPLLNNGVPIAVPHSTFNADSSGAFTISLDDNSLLTPSGSQWKFILCPNATVTNCSIITLGISGASVDISTQLNNALIVPVVNTVPTIFRGYNDTEALGGQGAVYWRVSDNTLRGCELVICPGSGWIAIGGGGGGGSMNISPGVAIGMSPNPINETTGVVYHLDAAVTPGSYTCTNLTVDQQGHVTSAASGTCGGTSTINNALQFSPAYYSAVGSSNFISGINPPTSPDGVPYIETWTSSGGLATIPTIVPPGLKHRDVTGTTATDTVLSTDCTPKRVAYLTSVSVIVTLPTATTLQVPNCVFIAVNGTSVSGTTVTVTPTTWTINTGSGSFNSTLVLQQGQIAIISVDSSGVNWNADVKEQSVSVSGGVTLTRSSNGITIKPIRAISFTIGDPGGTTFTAGNTVTDYITVPFACTISAYDLILQPSGTITVKFWDIASGTAAPTSANSINTSGVSISTGTSVHSTVVSDFISTSIAAYDRLAMNVTASATASFVNGVLTCKE